MAKAGDGGVAFEHVVHTVLVTEKCAPVADVARAIGMTPGALYGRLHGRSRFKADEIRRLIACVPDPRLIRYFVDDSRHIVAVRPSPNDPSAGVLPATVEALHGAIDLMNIVFMSLQDGPRLDHRERARVLAEVKDAETAIANLRAAVESGGA